MNPGLERLLALQEVDLRARGVETVLAALPARVMAAERRRDVARAATSAQQEALRALEVERRAGEREAESLAAQQKRFEAQTMQVKTNDELRALQHEIDDLRARRSTLETRVLESMEVEDQRRAALPPLEQAMRAAEEEVAAERAAVEAERSRLEAERATIAAERERVAAEVPADLRARYERVRQGKSDAAVVPLVRGACGGCFTAQPPAKAQIVRAGEQPVPCEYCGRLIVGLRESAGPGGA